MELPIYWKKLTGQCRQGVGFLIEPYVDGNCKRFRGWWLRDIIEGAEMKRLKLSEESQQLHLNQFYGGSQVKRLQSKVGW